MQLHFLAKIFWASLIGFDKSWENLRRNLNKSNYIWANLIRFGQNQNLASPKAFGLLRL